MAQFDPRRQPMRLAPHMLTAVAAISVALFAGRAYQPAQAEEVPPLTATQIALLTIYDMCKAVDRGMVMSDIKLLEKSGGKSGDWKAS